MSSPRLIRMLRSSLFEDVLSDCDSSDGERLDTQSLTDSLESSMSRCSTDEKAYQIYSPKLCRWVEVVFLSEKHLSDYGLEHTVKKLLEKTVSMDTAPRLPNLKIATPGTKNRSKRQSRSWTLGCSRPIRSFKQVNGIDRHSEVLARSPACSESRLGVI